MASVAESWVSSCVGCQTVVTTARVVQQSWLPSLARLKNPPVASPTPEEAQALGRELIESALAGNRGNGTPLQPCIGKFSRLAVLSASDAAGGWPPMQEVPLVPVVEHALAQQGHGRV